MDKLSLFYGIIIGLTLAMLIFALLYNFSLANAAYQDCFRNLQETNKYLDYCNRVVLNINSAIIRLNQSAFNFSVEIK